jgi:Domain of unknown function (DUF4160)
MTELSRFFGIIIRMFAEPLERHHSAHFHAYYQEHVAVFSISPVALIIRIDSSTAALLLFPKAKGQADMRWLNCNVLGIGLASLFSDWSHEIATTLMPAFLASNGCRGCLAGPHRGRKRRLVELRQNGI